MTNGPQVIPFYIVCDTSRSMRGPRIESVNAGLPLLFRTVASDPVIAHKARVAVISFATDAKVELPLSDLSTVVGVPCLTAGGQTNYRKAIEATRSEIEKDVQHLRSAGFSILRPFVYFITDGRPGDAWRRMRDEWIDKNANKIAPNIMSFGVANADESTLTRMSTQYSFVARDGVDPSVALREVMRHIANSVVMTATAVGEGQVALPVPKDDQHFRILVSPGRVA